MNTIFSKTIEFDQLLQTFWGFLKPGQPIHLGYHNSRSNSSVIEMSFLQLFEEKFRELNFMPHMFSCLLNKEKISCINHHIEIPHFFSK